MMRLRNRFYLYFTEKNNIYKLSKLYLCLLECAIQTQLFAFTIDTFLFYDYFLGGLVLHQIFKVNERKSNRTIKK